MLVLANGGTAVPILNVPVIALLFPGADSVTADGGAMGRLSGAGVTELILTEGRAAVPNEEVAVIALFPTFNEAVAAETRLL
jgi:hypothetical protein